MGLTSVAGLESAVEAGACAYQEAVTAGLGHLELRASELNLQAELHCRAQDQLAPGMSPHHAALEFTPMDER